MSFYGYKNSKELFNIIKNNQINFDDALKRQNEFLNKLSNIKIGKKNFRTAKKWLIILKKFIFLEKRFLIFLETMEKWFLMQPKKSKQNETKGKGLKILTPKQMLQRLPIALAQKLVIIQKVY